MSAVLTLLFLLIIAGVVAANLNEGLWGSAISFLNVVIAGLVAMNFFEPAAAYLAEQMSFFYYAADFICLWGIFGVTLLILSLATGFASNIKVKFFMPVEKAGSIIFSLLTGWVLVCFLAASLHTAPLARNFFFEAFNPEQKMFFGLAPDRQWFAFTHAVSAGALSPLNAGEDPVASSFDPRAEFMIKYASRRKEYENKPGFGPSSN